MTVPSSSPPANAVKVTVRLFVAIRVAWKLGGATERIESVHIFFSAMCSRTPSGTNATAAAGSNAAISEPSTRPSTKIAALTAIGPRWARTVRGNSRA